MLESRDFGIMKNEQNARILHDICQKRILFPHILGSKCPHAPVPTAVCGRAPADGMHAHPCKGCDVTDDGDGDDGSDGAGVGWYYRRW